MASTQRSLSISQVQRRSVYGRRESQQPVTTRPTPKKQPPVSAPVAVLRLIRNKWKILTLAVFGIGLIVFVIIPVVFRGPTLKPIQTEHNQYSIRKNIPHQKRMRALEAGFEQPTFVAREDRKKRWNKRAFGRKDGLKLIYDGEDHPIFELIKRAQLRWKNLQDRQSTTFAQAIKEYKRRYKRNPPKGFDQWYAFAKMNDVHLIDEFDLIEKNLYPFRAFSGASFRRRLETLKDTTPFAWGLDVRNGNLTRIGEGADHDRAKDTATICERFVDKLDNLCLWYHRHDASKILIPWEEKERLEKLVQAGQFDKDDDLDLSHEHPSYPEAAPVDGVMRTCPPDSFLRTPGLAYGYAPMDWDGTEMPELPKSEKDGKKVNGALIDSFKQYIQLCHNHRYCHFHAGADMPHYEPTHLLPLVGGGPTPAFSDIYAPIVEQFGHSSVNDIAWEHRRNSAAVWRGQITGSTYFKLCAWKSTHRARLHFLSHEKKGSRNISLANFMGKSYSKQLPKKDLNAAFLDASLVGEPIQCNEEDGTCQNMRDAIEFADPTNLEFLDAYKYSIDVDGNSWSGRFRRLMLTQSAVLKATIYQEYWTDWAIPWLHFIPIQVDYSDLWDILAFFRGDLDGKDSHDDLAKYIALSGRDWAETHMRWEDVETYQYRLMLEYARLQNADLKNMDYEGDGSVEPKWEETQEWIEVVE